MIKKIYSLLAALKVLDFIPSVCLRIYLVPVFFLPGMAKFNSFENTVWWFEHTLGIPFPELNAWMAIASEVGGSVLIGLGLGTRLACIPLLFVMGIAALTVHVQNGWQVIHDPLSAFPITDVDQAIRRKQKAISILKEHGNYEWLTEYGRFGVINNGVEFIAAYAVMLLTLLFLGGGRYFSIDYYLKRLFFRTHEDKKEF